MSEPAKKQIQQYQECLEKIADRDSYDYTILLKKIHTFLQNAYDTYKDQNNIMTFYQEYFQQINSDSPVAFIIFLYISTTLKLNDKAQQLSEISQRFENLSKNLGSYSADKLTEKFWHYYRKILLYLSKTLKKTFDQKIKDIQDKIEQNLYLKAEPKEEPKEALKSNDTTQQTGNTPKFDKFSNDRIVSLQLFAIYFECFPEKYSEHLNSNIQTLVGRALTEENIKIEYYLKALKGPFTSIAKSEINKLSIPAMLTINFNDAFTSTTQNQFHLVQFLLQIHPECKDLFDITTTPINYLQSRDPRQRQYAFDSIGLWYEMIKFHPQNLDGEKFKNDVLNILKQFDTLVKKKALNRDEALIGLADYIFARKGNFSEAESKLLKKIRKTVEEAIDSEAAGYCELSFLISTNKSPPREEIKKSLDLISKISLSTRLVDGFLKLINLTQEDYFYCARRILQMANEILLSFDFKKKSAEKTRSIAVAFQCVQKLQSQSHLLILPLVIKYSYYMMDENLQIRKTASDVVLTFQKANPSIDIIQRVLAVISTETNEAHRLYLFENLHKQPSDETLIPIIRPLLHDFSPEIRKATLEYLTELAHLPSASSLLHNFLSENINAIEHKLSTKEGLECFSIVSSVAHKNPNAIYSQSVTSILSTFARYLITYIINSPCPISTQTIRLLTHLIPLSPSCVDVDKLCNHVINLLQTHASFNRIDATSELLETAFEYTDLKFTIYDKHREIIIRLLEISFSKGNGEKLLNLFGSIGSINPITIRDMMRPNEEDAENTSKSNTAAKYLRKFSPEKAKEALTYTAVGLSVMNILDILNEESLSSLHAEAFRILIKKIMVKYRPIINDLESDILQRITNLLTSSNNSTIDVIVNYLKELISFLRDRFAPLVPYVFDLVTNNWTKLDQGLLGSIVMWMVTWNREVCLPYLPKLALLYTSVFETADVTKFADMLTYLVTFGRALSTLDHIIFPPILDWIQLHAKEDIAKILKHLKEIVIFAQSVRYSSQILNTMIQVGQVNPGCSLELLHIILSVGLYIGEQFLLYVPHISLVFDINQLNELNLYVVLLSKKKDYDPNKFVDFYLKPIAQAENKEASVSKIKAEDGIEEIPIIDQTYDDEQQRNQWYNDLFEHLVAKSPVRAISVCYPLVLKNFHMRDSLFPIAFTLLYFTNYQPNANHQSMWNYKASITHILESFFTAKNVPNQIIRTFLNVTELFEILQIDLPYTIQDSMIIEKAESAGRIAQALRLSEMLFEDGDDDQTERIIVYNQQLGLPLAAHGALRIAEKRATKSKPKNGAVSKGTLNERLGLWEDALECYTDDLVKSPKDQRALIGQLNCLSALSRYKELKEASMKGTFKEYEAKANWHLYEDDQFIQSAKDLNSRIQALKEHNSNEQGTLSSIKPQNNLEEAEYYYALYLTMSGKFEEAENIITEMKQDLIPLIFPSISEDYDRVFPSLSRLSLLNEIEEVITLKKLQNDASDNFDSRQSAGTAMKRIKKVWSIRFAELPDDPVLLHETLRIRSLVVNDAELKPEWLRLIDVATASGRFELSQQAIDHLIKIGLQDDPDTHISKAKLLWALGDDNKDKAIDYIKEKVPNTNQNMRMLLGKWLFEKKELTKSREQISKINLNTAEGYKLWSQVNYDLYQKNPKDVQYLSDSFEASLKGVSLSSSDQLIFTLRILSILFKKANKQIYQKFREIIKSIPLHVWIIVLPQIIARANSNNTELRELIAELIYNIGVEQPHVVLYSLMVPLKSDLKSNAEGKNRQVVASTIFDRLSLLFPTLVEQMNILANELIRAAVTQWEAWNTQLDEASKAFITRNNPNEMIEILQPLHNQLHKPPETFYEVMFQRGFGQPLEAAEACIKRYTETHAIENLYQAWSYYFNVFHQVKPFLSEVNKIPLEDAAPILASMRSTELLVPGTYEYNAPLIQLSEISPVMSVMTSKQRPRRMAMKGSNGVTYTFLLKAHEDTRLDERVMQFFTLVNSFVLHSSIPMKDKLNITTYNVIPLTAEVGLIGWVPSCNTLYEIIRDYRKKMNIPLEFEYQVMVQIAKQKNQVYEALTPEEQQPIFEDALKHMLPQSTNFENAHKNKGNEMKYQLFAMSDDSNHWINRRVAYSTSLAMTSMAGYILGLGDRHMSNIMIKKRSAKLVHIDFGDCFEVAQHRDKFPEKVPFRLTRMLQRALELSKPDGTFTTCCQNVMEMFRTNKSQIVGLLEVFIYDPLLQWLQSPSTAEMKNTGTDSSFENESIRDSGSKSASGIMERIENKLKGTDFDPNKVLAVNDQVDKLIEEATSNRNLCQMYRGWFPAW